METRKMRKKTKVLKEIIRIMEMALSTNELNLADRYVEIARRLCMKARIRMPSHLKLFICKGCKRILIPGKTARFRIKQKGGKKMVVISCFRCGHVYRKIVEPRKFSNK